MNVLSFALFCFYATATAVCAAATDDASNHSTSTDLRVDTAVFESINWPVACMSGLKASGFTLLDFEKFDRWFNETSVLQLAQTGAYVGAEDIAEYARFFVGPFFDSYRPTGFPQLLPISFGQNECVVVSANNVEATTDGSLAKRSCLEHTVGWKMHFSVSDQDGSDFLMHRVNVFLSEAFLQHLYENALDTSGVRDYVCETVLASKCKKTFALNGLTLDSCKSQYDALPLVGDGAHVDGNSKGCRILHSAFAETNDKHCPHLSFVPEEDYQGRVKCQVSGGVQHGDLFSDLELKFIREHGEELGLPSSTLYAECKNTVESKLQPSYLRQLQNLAIEWILVTVGITVAMFVPQIRHNWRLALVVQFLICFPSLALFFNDCNSSFLKLGALVIVHLDPRCDLSSLARGWVRWKLKYTTCGRLLRLGSTYSIRMLHHACGALLLLNSIDYCKIGFGPLASLTDLDIRFQVLAMCEVIHIAFTSGIALRGRGYRSFGRLKALMELTQATMACWLVATEWDDLPQLYYLGVVLANTATAILSMLSVSWFMPTTHEIVRDGGSTLDQQNPASTSTLGVRGGTHQHRGSVIGSLARLASKKLQTNQHANIEVELPMQRGVRNKKSGATGTRRSSALSSLSELSETDALGKDHASLDA